MPREAPVFRFEEDVDQNLVPLVLGRRNVHGYTIRWSFTPEGVMLTMPLALRDHPAVHGYPGDAMGTGFPPQKEAPDAT